MRIVRSFGHLVVLILVGGPLLALAVSAIGDQGPDGDIRTSAVHFGLAAADPFLRESLRNSLALASATAALSLVLGVPLARIMSRWRFWGREPLALVALGPMAVPPLFAALGIRQALESLAGPGNGVPQSLRVALDTSGPWLAWLLSGAISGVPWVTLAVSDALSRIDPLSEDAARQLGVGKRRAWRALIWPLVRPAAAGAMAGVFVRTLGDPGAPLALGLRRTLAYQALESVSRSNTAPRAAWIGLAIVVLSLVGRLLSRWWGGPVGPHTSRPAIAERAPWWRSAGFLFVLSVWGLLAWLPVVMACVPDSLGMGPGPWEDPITSLQVASQNSGARQAILNSLGLGLTVGGVLLALTAWCGSGLAGRKPTHPLNLARRLSGVGSLALALGVALSPALLVSGSIEITKDYVYLRSSIRDLAELLDPMFSSLALVWAVSASWLPLALAWTSTPSPAIDRAETRRGRYEAALLAGVSESRARRLARTTGPTTLSWSGWFLVCVLSATAVAPALVLSPSPERRPLVPTALRLADAPDSGPRRAGLLIALGTLGNLAALTLAARARPRHLGTLAAQGFGPI